MNLWHPNELYRFRGANSPHFAEELQNLAKGKVWLNFVNTLNDPFEGTLRYEPLSYELFSKKHRQYMSSLSQRFPELDLLPGELDQAKVDYCNSNAQPFAAAVRTKIVVTSFCKSWTSPLLWAHYANQFSGLCLKFEYDPSIQHQSGVEPPPFYQVQYWRNQAPAYSGFDFFLETELSKKIKQIENSVTPHKLKEISDLAHEPMIIGAISKSFDWVYEEEFRLVSYIGVPGYYYVPNMKLSCVIFGPKAPEYMYYHVISSLGCNIKYMKLEISPRHYELYLTDIDDSVVNNFLGQREADPFGVSD